MPLPVPSGVRPAAHPVRFTIQKIGGERTIRRPYPFGYPSLSRRVRALPASLSEIGPSGGLGAHNRSGKGRMLVTRLSFGGKVVPRGRFARPLPRYEGGVPLSGLAGNIWSPPSDLRAPFRDTSSAPRCLGVEGKLVPRTGFAPATCALPMRCTSQCASTAWPPETESNSRNRGSEPQCRCPPAGRNWHPRRESNSQQQRS